MILRKPYAFLIKNFRLINFLILLFSSYILYRTSIALDFFNEYVDTRQFIESETLISDTIPISIVFFSILLIVGCTSIAVLFKKKDKPALFYIAGVIYYFIFIIICFISRGMIGIIIFDGLDPRIARIIRDIWLIAAFLQIPVIGFSLVRTLGFDIKKFNFGEDLEELKISDEDNEEIEVSTRFDADKLKMKAAMQREELKSFFYENKFMIILILILLIVVIPTTLIARNIVLNKRYKVGEVIDLDDFKLKITGAYVTKKDYKGNTLFHGDNSYLIVSFNINNLKEKERGITLNNLRLEVNNKIYMPKISYYESFKDIGNGYNDNKISKESKDYIAVYTISDEDLNHEMIVRYADKLTVKDSKVNAFYYRTIVEPENIDIDKTKVNRSVGEELVIDYKELKNTKFKITHYNLKDKFTYDVSGKTKYIINNTGLVLSINYEFTSDNISFSEFIDNYVTIKYKYNNCNYTQKINNITPYSSKNEIYFAVTESMKDASEINLIVNVRNTEYVYKIK